MLLSTHFTYNLHSLNVIYVSFLIFNRPTEKLAPSDIEIRVGTNKWWYGGAAHRVDEIIAHEHYDQLAFANDIALIHVQTPIEFNERVQPIKYSAETVPIDSLLYTTGWGRLQLGGKFPDKLQILSTRSISNKECQERVGEPIHEGHLCTFQSAFQGICHGDSGGPLVNVNMELVGLTSFTLE